MSDYPKYQYSIFLDGKREQLVIRAEDWEEFLKLKSNANTIIKKKQEKEQQELGNCDKCGAPNLMSQKGKPYCSKKCWL